VSICQVYALEDMYLKKPERRKTCEYIEYCVPEKFYVKQWYIITVGGISAPYIRPTMIGYYTPYEG